MLLPLLFRFSTRLKRARLQPRLGSWLLVPATLLGTAHGLRAQSIQSIESASKTAITAGGILSPATSTVVVGGKASNLVLSGFRGTILKFQADTGNGFVDMVESFDYFELRVTTRFRAVVLSPSGATTTSTVATVYVQELPLPGTAAAKVAFENRQASFARSLTLKLSPLATQDPIASTLMLGVEYRLNPQLGIEASYGHQFTALQVVTLGLTKGRYDYQYSKYKLELRRYLSPRTKNPNQETYFAGQAFFTPQRYTRYGNNFYRDGRYVSYDRAYVAKDVTGFCFKAGTLWHVGQRWQLEAGIGAGVRYVDVRYNMLNERKASSANEPQANFFNQIEAPGARFDLDVEIVAKVGYVLARPRRQSPAAAE